MRIVYHCADRVGPAMAGPGIRAVELARRLAARHEVTLVADGAESLRGEPFEARPYSPAALRDVCRGAGALVTQGFGFPLDLALRLRGRLVLDLYDPVQLEQLAQFGPAATPGNRISLAHVRARLLVLLSRADHVLCASAPQRALWLGWLGAAGRLTPEVLDGDPEARRLVAVVPFGIPSAPPVRAGSPLREAVGAGEGERVALFWGGMWDWMDPALAIRAVAALGPGVHLAFIAGSRPGTVTARADVAAARQLAAELGVERRVHLLDRWIPYDDRGAWLLDADVAVTAHRPSLEAEFAFRTRLLDCLWAALPAACTRGDVLAAEGERDGFAALADPGDAAGLARAVGALLAPDANARAREAARRAAARYGWDAAAATVGALLERPAPPRPPVGAPGELAGAPLADVARELGARLARRLRGRAVRRS